MACIRRHFRHCNPVLVCENAADLGKPACHQCQPGQMHLIGFADTGTVTLNESPWTAAENRRTLSGAGIGLSWADYNNFVVKTYWAHKVGNAVATSAPDKNGRFWIQGVKYF